MADEDGVSSMSDPVVTTAVNMSPTNDLDLRNDIQVEEEVGQCQNTIQGFLGKLCLVYMWPAMTLRRP